MVGRDGFLDRRGRQVEMSKSEDEVEESSKKWGVEKLRAPPLSEIILGTTSKCLLEERK